MTLYDKNFPKLCITMEHRDYGEVFITVHTLVLNMLYSSSALVKHWHYWNKSVLNISFCSHVERNSI